MQQNFPHPKPWFINFNKRFSIKKWGAWHLHWNVKPEVWYLECTYRVKICLEGKNQTVSKTNRVMSRGNEAVASKKWPENHPSFRLKHISWGHRTACSLLWSSAWNSLWESRYLTYSIKEIIFEQQVWPSMLLQQWLDLPKAKELPVSSQRCSGVHLFRQCFSSLPIRDSWAVPSAACVLLDLSDQV